MVESRKAPNFVSRPRSRATRPSSMSKMAATRATTAPTLKRCGLEKPLPPAKAKNAQARPFRPRPVRVRTSGLKRAKARTRASTGRAKASPIRSVTIGPDYSSFATFYNGRMGLREKLETVPARPGVYLFKDKEGKVLYVGKARLLRDRVRQYFQASRPADPFLGDFVAEIADLDLALTDNEMEALALENNFIKRHQPKYNVRLRDDKNHPYLKLTLAEEYPRLHIVRRVAEDANAYGGPYIPASMGRRTAAVVHKVFGIRSCKETLNGRRPRPCLQYQIHRCLAPCVLEICGPERYRQSADDARLFLEGRTEEVLRRL